MKYLFLLFLMIGVLSTATGQANENRKLTPQNAPTFARRESDTLRTMLKLSNVQKAQVDSVEQTFLTKRANIPEQIPAGQRTSIINGLVKWRREQLKQILNPAQLTLYDQLIEQRKQRADNKRKALEEKYRSSKG